MIILFSNIAAKEKIKQSIVSSNNLTFHAGLMLCCYDPGMDVEGKLNMKGIVVSIEEYSKKENNAT